MRDRQILPGNTTLASGLAVAMSLLLLAGCATTGSKPKLAAAVEPKPTTTVSAAERLADALNTKAQMKREKGDAGYRDPMVRSVNGPHPQIVAQHTNNRSFFPPAPVNTTATATAADQPAASIAGLVTQPTGVNANRSSIYSAPPPIAVNPDGTLAKTQPQGITPIMRSVYSMPPGAQQDAAQQPGDGGMPVGQTSEAVIPPPVIRNSAYSQGSPMKPTADATPSKIMPARGSSAKKIDSKEALMLAHVVASNGQGQQTSPVMQQAVNASGL
ncbi:MAG: hypothetical protein KGI75_28070 [Rhizobiaceae bacterium]|nr:hypothetical protein [Rhizobiaceae bacterium]